MCDQRNNFLFHSKGCKLMDGNKGKIVVKEIGTLGNVCVLE
jgi:hypothetical protein